MHITPEGINIFANGCGKDDGESFQAVGDLQVSIRYFFYSETYFSI